MTGSRSFASSERRVGGSRSLINPVFARLETVTRELMPTVISLFAVYISLDPELVDRRNWVLFQVASTVLCLVKNDYFLTMTAGKEKFAIRLTIQKLPNGSKGI